jgi:hypothetical protein
MSNKYLAQNTRYFRFVDDILFIYKEEFTNINDMLSEFNTWLPKQKLTSELEENGKINLLDFTIMNSQNSKLRNPQEAH